MESGYCEEFATNEPPISPLVDRGYRLFQQERQRNDVCRKAIVTNLTDSSFWKPVAQSDHNAPVWQNEKSRRIFLTENLPAQHTSSKQQKQRAA